MQTDALGRTLPWETHDDPDEERVAKFEFSEPDRLLFGFMDRHGYASSNYLRYAQRNVRTARTHTLKRLKEFCRGSISQGKILIAPDAQFRQRFAHARYKVYKLAPAAERAIRAAGTASSVRPSRSNSFVHDFMQAAVAGSFELTAPDHGFTYMPRSEVLMHEYSGTARTAANPMSLPVPQAKPVNPDDVFALVNSAGKKRFFLVEIDRDSESMRPSAEPKAGITYFGKKLATIDQLISDGGIHRWLGVARPRILIVTTNPSRARQIAAEVATLRNAALFYITVVEEFGDDWRVPNRILTELLDTPWLTVNGPKLITE